MLRAIYHALFVAFLIVTTAATFIFNDYLNYHRVEVEVVEKVAGSSVTDPHIVYKRVEDGLTFVKHVSPGTFASSEVGDRQSLALRPIDIDRSISKLLLHMTAPLLASLATTICLIFYLFGAFIPAPRQDRT